MSARNLASALAISIVCGCSNYPVRERVDDVVCKPTLMDVAPTTSSAKSAAAGTTKDADWRSKLKKGAGGDSEVDADFNLIRTSAEEDQADDKYEPKLQRRILGHFDKNAIPGANVKQIVLPKYNRDDPEPYRKAAKEYADKNFPRLPALAKEFEPSPGPNHHALTLSDLQRMARENSPLLLQAVAAVEAARGAAIQSGMYPNPTVSLAGVGVGPSGGPNIGPSIGQEIVVGNKLGFKRAIAEKDLKMAQIALRRAETDLSWNVRSQYFAVLVAQESIKINRALVNLTDEVYNALTDAFKAGGVTPYEPAQMGVFAEQTRAALVVARNNYGESWKLLATTMGLAGMPPTEVAGRITGPNAIRLPIYKYNTVLAHVLRHHTDALTADENVAKARYSLQLNKVMPIPDPTVLIGGFYDNNQTGGDYRWVGTFGVDFPLPVWDQNKGGIRQAQAQLLQMAEEPHRVRNALTASMADAFRRYDENMVLVKMYNETIMPKQVTAFIGAVKRHDVAPDETGYWDLINAEQSLLTLVGNYVPLLQNLWQAVADVANLQQTNDVYQLSEKLEAVSMVDLERMIECCHPCGIRSGNALRGVDLNWHFSASDVAPSAGPAQPNMKTSATGKQPRSIVPILDRQPKRAELGDVVPLNEGEFYTLPPADVALPLAVPVQVSSAQTAPVQLELLPLPPPPMPEIDRGHGTFPAPGKQ